MKKIKVVFKSKDDEKIMKILGLLDENNVTDVKLEFKDYDVTTLSFIYNKE